MICENRFQLFFPSFPLSFHSYHTICENHFPLPAKTICNTIRAPIASGLFQSTRTPGRTRLKSYLFRVSDQCFNPRVLAGGRDFPPAQRKPRCQGFNPRVLAGGRDFLLWHHLEDERFQSTRPRGRTRPKHPMSEDQLTGFNPRVLAGGRDFIMGIKTNDQMFQSTRPRGRTRH